MRRGHPNMILIVFSQRTANRGQQDWSLGLGLEPQKPVCPTVLQPTSHAAGETLLSGLLPVGLAHPAAQLALGPLGRDGNRVPLVFGDNHRFALHSSYILGVGACQPAEDQSIGAKFSQGARPWTEPVVVCSNLPVFILGEPLDHPFHLQAGQDGGRLLRRARYHVHIGRLALVHCPLHKVGHRGGQRGEGRQGAQAHPSSNTAMPERENNKFKVSFVEVCVTIKVIKQWRPSGPDSMALVWFVLEFFYIVSITS